MKFILLLSTLLFSTIAGATPWNSFIGCYDTISINGVSAQPAKYFQSKIYEAVDQEYKTVDGNEITSLIIKINWYDSTDDLDKTWVAEHAFLNAPESQITVVENSVTFEYRGRIFHKTSGEFPMWYITQLTQNSDGTISVSDEIGYREVYVLAPVPCSP